MTEMKYPPWRQRLARSLHINRSQLQAKYYQVASVGSDGRAKNRTMVFRGFLNATHSLLSVTDCRSDKIPQWNTASAPYFEICWYFSGSREQFRISGDVVLLSPSLALSVNESLLGGITKADILKQQWLNLSPTARQAFFAGTPKAPYDENNHAWAGNSPVKVMSHDNLSTISEHFCVVLFIPEAVDYLNLKATPQERYLYSLQENWQETRVNA
ncbi:MAG: pyridoxamine 5'-phosphate oxidase [Paraglaciecola sp.]|nr:pyridoxamine 5'-phosphate oxidase [Paraglaciecola sp.]